MAAATELDSAGADAASLASDWLQEKKTGVSLGLFSADFPPNRSIPSEGLSTVTSMNPSDQVFKRLKVSAPSAEAIRTAAQQQDEERNDVLFV